MGLSALHAERPGFVLRAARLPIFRYFDIPEKWRKMVIGQDKGSGTTFIDRRYFELPKHSGSGDTASTDGTKWDVYEQNLLSEWHISPSRTSMR